MEAGIFYNVNIFKAVIQKFQIRDLEDLNFYLITFYNAKKVDIKFCALNIIVIFNTVPIRIS